jgi:hypothetical protein
MAALGEQVERGWRRADLVEHLAAMVGAQR